MSVKYYRDFDRESLDLKITLIGTANNPSLLMHVHDVFPFVYVLNLFQEWVIALSACFLVTQLNQQLVTLFFLMRLQMILFLLI